MIRILIIDDHPVVRKGVRRILEEGISFLETDEAGNGETALKLLHNNDYDLVCMDINLPGKNGMVLLESFKILKPELPVLILSMYPEKDYALRAVKMGASGYLTKDSLDEELIRAVNKILNGHKYISDSLAELLIDHNGLNKPLHTKLSNREFEIMISIVQGKSVKEIAEAMAISDKTVSTYKSRILEKLECKSTVDLIKYALQAGLA
ncbi:MAG TPA: response regulator transcription factor [Bacteroidetes bacterium]|nr:response regulator transcription factor [Bacteroidota bacterium]